MIQPSRDQNEQAVQVTGHARNIRRAAIDDVEELLAIDHRAVAGDTERSAAIRAHVFGGRCWVHSGQARMDGYAVLLPHHFFGRDFVDLLVVASSVRRSGIATGLLRALVRMEGTEQVFTSTNRSNTPMRELLRKEGWQLSGELDGLDADDGEMVFFTSRS
jgi:GNAT superfamily N-acetyltransferase